MINRELTAPQATEPSVSNWHIPAWNDQSFKNEQDDRLAESRETVKKECSSMRGEGQGSEDIFDTVGGYKVIEDVEEKIDEEDTFYSVIALENMLILQKKHPELAEIIMYLTTGDLAISLSILIMESYLCVFCFEFEEICLT